MSSAFLPISAEKTSANATEVVVFPTPPFRFITEKTCVIGISPSFAFTKLGLKRVFDEQLSQKQIHEPEAISATEGEKPFVRRQSCQSVEELLTSAQFCPILPINR
jgi:hypothetical protein